VDFFYEQKEKARTAQTLNIQTPALGVAVLYVWKEFDQHDASTYVYSWP
jgi:hypothetical protein